MATATTANKAGFCWRFPPKMSLAANNFSTPTGENNLVRIKQCSRKYIKACKLIINKYQQPTKKPLQFRLSTRFLCRRKLCLPASQQRLSVAVQIQEVT